VMRQAAERDEQDQLSTDEAEAMRRVVMAAVGDAVPARTASPWMRRPVLVAATIVAVISVGIATALHLDLTNPPEPPQTTQLMPEAAPIDITTTADATTPSRQLQFVTAGGTRIIWVFNSDLNLKANVR
jgi:cytochrome c-type biogenesis protein CcmH/NrfG